MSYLCWLCLSLPLVFVGGHMSYLCWLCLSLPLVFVGGHMSYLCWLCLSLPLVVCRRAHVLFVLVVFFFTSKFL